MIKHLSEHEFHEFTKIIKDEKTGKEKRVRDLRAQFDHDRQRISTLGPLFQESPEDYKARMASTRLRAFDIQGCKSGMSEEVFSYAGNIREAIHEGFINIPTPMIKNILGWHEERPFSVPGTNRKRGYFLCGETGKGKSFLAKCHMLHIYDGETVKNRNMSAVCRVVTWFNLLQAYQNSFKTDSKKQFEDSITEPKYLLIDDIGREKPTEFNMSYLTDLLGHRIEKKWKDGKRSWTFFTSNHTINDLPYDDPLKRRIRDLGLEVNIGGTMKSHSYAAALEGNPTYS